MKKRKKNERFIKSVEIEWIPFEEFDYKDRNYFYVYYDNAYTDIIYCQDGVLYYAYTDEEFGYTHEITHYAVDFDLI